MASRLVPVLVSAVFLCACAAPASAQLFFPRSEPRSSVFAPSEDLLAPREIVRTLYRRYGLARVLDVRRLGDVYEASAVDRRGDRIMLTVDGYTGEILERRSARLEGEPPLVPPRPIPGAPPREEWPGGRLPPAGTMLPQGEARPLARPVAPYDLGSGRRAVPGEAARPRHEARVPAEGSSPALRERAPRATVTAPKPPPAVAAPAAPPAEKGPATAARPPAAGSATQAPRTGAPASPPGPVEPPPPTTTTPAAREPAPAAPAVREASPAQRLPEPLIDPKTGKPNPAAEPGAAPPVVPLDEAGKKDKKDAPIQIVPPATFD